MEKNNDISSLFNYLRPVAVSVAKDPSISNLNTFFKTVSSLEEQSINKEDFLEYLLYPFKLSLKRSNSLKEKQEILCFQCLEILIEKSNPNILSENILLWIFNLFSIYFGTNQLSKDNGTVKEFSEEQQLSILDFLKTFLMHVDAAPVVQVYSEEKRMPLIGHIVSILLDIISRERNKQLQITSIYCLCSLGGKRFPSRFQKDTFGPVVSSFLPGICSKVWFLLSSKTNIGYKVIVETLNMFSYCVSIVVYDREKEKEKNFEVSQASQKSEKNCSESNFKQSLKIDQNDEWLSTTSNNLCKVLKDIFSIVLANKHPKVQMSLLNLVDIVTSKCMENLTSAIPDCIDVLVKSSVSDISEVMIKSKTILESSSQNFYSKDSQKVRLLLDKRLYTLFLSLPRIMNSVNEDLKLVKLQTMQGYLKFYGNSMRSVLLSSSQMNQILTSLLQILELQTKNISLVEERTVNPSLTFQSNTSRAKFLFYKINFKHFRDTAIYDVVYDMIEEFAIHSDIYTLIDYLQEKAQYSKMFSNESILLINYLMFFSRLKGNNLKSMTEMLIQLYTSKELFHKQISNYSKSNAILLNENESLINQSISLEKIHKNVQTIILVIQGFALFSQVLSKDFDIYFIQILYPLLEKVGSTNMAIHTAAMECFQDISKYCGYKDIAEIIEKNSDYLLNSITLEFRRFVVVSAAPAVFCVVLKFCSEDLLTLVADAMEDLLKNLDEYQEEVAIELLLVLKFFSITVEKYHVNIVQADNKRGRLSSESYLDLHNNNVSEKDFLLSYFQTFDEAMGNVDDYSDHDIDEEEINRSQFEETEVSEENEKPVVVTPHYFSIVIKSLERCVYYLASNIDKIKYKALEVTFHGVLALRERENDLLPLLHKLWPAVIILVKSNNEIVTLKALDVLSVMVKHSGDFMRQRISKEFVKHSLDLLRVNQKSLTPNQSMYIRSNKIVIRLITFLGDNVPILRVDKQLFCAILSNVIPFFDSRLHPEVQSVVIETLKKFLCYDYCATWLALHSFLPNITREDANVQLLYEVQFVNEPEKFLIKNIQAVL